MAVTQIQLAVGYAAMANGGFRVQPQLVQAIGSQAVTSVAPSQVLSTGIAAELKDTLHHVTASVPVVRPGQPHPGLPGRRQDRHGAGLGRGRRHLHLQQLQLQLRRLRRRRRSRGDHRGAHRRGGPRGQGPGRADAEHHLVPAVPADRDRHHFPPERAEVHGPGRRLPGARLGRGATALPPALRGLAAVPGAHAQEGAPKGASAGVRATLRARRRTAAGDAGRARMASDRE